MSPAQTLAKLVLEAARIREDSYDHAAAKRATEEHGAQSHFVDYSKFYGLTLREAVAVAANEHGTDSLADPAFLLLYCSWNDALEWAEKIIPQPEETQCPPSN